MNESMHTGAAESREAVAAPNPGMADVPATEATVGDYIDFPPFEETIVCPGCNRPLQMMLQPVHATIQIRCPRCVRQLTPLIRRAIREHLRG